jgi:SAM-dependent methyltransferase
MGRNWANAAYTGDPERSWLDDLVARGPFRDVAVLGCDEEQFEKAWLSRDGSPELDIYELTPHAIRQVRRGLGDLRRRARFIRSDLNFVELPPASYDLIWSSGCLHHVINLEHLFAQVARALRPGGLFALHDYVGERRRQYTPERLARMNALLREVPAGFRLSAIEEITAPDPADLSTFCSARSDEILPLAERYFEPVHVARFGTLFPLPLFLDLDAIAREDPALFERLQAAERDAARDPQATVSSAYAVYRRRS